VTAWLRALQQPGHRGAEALATLGFAAAVIGLLLGYGSAMALFYYDGHAPVNIVRVLAVFVALQAVTLALFFIAALPGKVPGAKLLRGLSPGRLTTLAMRWLPSETRDALQSIVGRSGAHQVVYGRVQKWQVLAWSQTMALAFNAAAIAGAMQLIVFSDLSFGWGTTLDVDAEAMHRVTQTLSLPWQSVWPEAQPSAALVEATQTYRAQDFELSDTEASASARWWPFLVMCLLVYGLLPRVVSLIATRWRLRHAVVRGVALTPGVDRLCERLVSSLVLTTAAEHETANENDAVLSETPLPSNTAGRVIRWADAGPDTPGVMNAGGDRTFAQDRAAIDYAAAPPGTSPETPPGNASGSVPGEASENSAEGTPGAGVLVRTKAWEPPVLEFLDFLGDLRQAMGEGRVIEVQPIGEGDRRVWQKKLASVGDPWLRMVGENNSGSDHGNNPPDAGKNDHENTGKNDYENDSQSEGTPA